MPRHFFARGVTRHPLTEPPRGFRLADRSVPVAAADRERVAELISSWRFKAHAGFEVPSVPPEPGEDGVLALRVCGIRFAEPVRIVWRDTRGFGYETLPGHPLRGEESFVLEHGRFTVRSLSRPASLRWWLLAPLLRIIQRRSVRLYLEAIEHAASSEPRTGPG